MFKIALTACTMLAPAMLVGSAHADNFRFSIGAGHPATSAWIASVQDFFVPEVTKRAEELGHTIVWNEAYGSAVCKLGECLEAVETGFLDMAIIITPFETSKLISHNFAYHVPFGPKDPALGAKIAWETYEAVPAMKELLKDRYNQVYLSAGMVGNYGIVTTFPWSTIDELKGRKISAAGPNLPWLTAIGAVPVQGTLNDAYTSLQTGVYDGWVMYPDGVSSFKLHEVAPHYMNVDFGVVPAALLTINADTYEGLPADLQDVLHSVGRDWNEYEGKVIAEHQKNAEEQIKAVQLSDEEKARWAHEMPNFPKEKMAEMTSLGHPSEVIEEYIRILKENGHVLPREWLDE